VTAGYNADPHRSGVREINGLLTRWSKLVDQLASNTTRSAVMPRRAALVRSIDKWSRCSSVLAAKKEP
jgi:hypothetical protein